MGALLILSPHCFAQNWKDLQWIRLLHMNETLTGGHKSEADGPGFFIHKNGKYSPKDELKSLIHELNVDNPDEDKNAFCQYPARVRWLRSIGYAVPESKVSCTKRDRFRERMSAKSVAIVFSSYYLNNPASSFGHTLIRLGKGSHEDEMNRTATELLDTGINYGANTGNAGPILYSLGGLAGLFVGTFSAIPYYYKVRQYNDYETRDLWTYHLNFSQTEIDFMVDHIWELGQTYFNYFFLSENCSYHVLTVLEAVRPSIDLRQHMPYMYAIPSETLKTLEAEKVVGHHSFRPAPSTAFYHQLNMLSSQEKKDVHRLVFDQKPIGEYSPERKALVYDTALSLVDFKFAKQIMKGDGQAQELKKPLLIARSKIPVRSPDLDFSKVMASAPHLGHGQKRLSLSGINRDGKNYLDTEWRFAFHDVLDRSLGYPPRTRLEIMKMTLRTDGEDYQVRDFYLVDAFTFGKWDMFNKSSSWKVRLGQWQTRYRKQDLSTQGFLGGYGYSYPFSKFTPYFLVHGESSYVSEEIMKMKFAYGSDAGLIFDLSDTLKYQSSLEWRAYPWNESRFINELRFTNNEYGLGLYHQSYLIDGVQDFGIRSFFYF